MNKKIIYVAIFTSLIFTGCDEFLTEEPQQSIIADQFPVDEEGVRALMNGVRGRFQEDDMGGSNFILIPDIMSDHIQWTGSFTSYRNLARFQHTPTNAEVTSMWNNGYEVINNANLVLQAIDELELTDVDELRGEALFFRGVLHFELVRWFGAAYNDGDPSTNPGVPIMLEPVTNLDELVLPSRSSVQAVYDQAAADLLEAINLLPPTRIDISAAEAPAYPGQNAARGYLMRLRMQQQDYDEAAQLAADIISTGTYSLNGEVSTYFTVEFSGESIYEVSHTVLDAIGVNSCLPCIYYTGAARDDANYTPSFFTDVATQVVTASQHATVNATGDTIIDTRVRDLIEGNGTGNNPFKYTDDINFSDNAPTLRYAEIILSRAEALARTTGLTQEAVDLLNEIRSRALRVQDKATGNTLSNAPALYSLADFANANELIDAILVERAMELAAEGQRLHDIKRLEIGPFTTGAGGTASWDDDILVFPIPQSEIDANGNIGPQNPGYGG